MATSYKPPGRLGDPEMSLETEPRALPAMVEQLRALGMATNTNNPPTDHLPVEMFEKYVLGHIEAGAEVLCNEMDGELPGDKDEPDIDFETITIDGVDGNDIKLYITRPQGSLSAGVALPAVLHIHGGAMVWQQTDCKINLRWCKSLALQGLVIVMVEFRNAYIKGKPRNPFPCGLNDCASAAKYVHAHKKELGISTLITSGESGGGNLALATALKANREGWMEAIDGVFGVAPYIAGAAWGWTKEQQLAELPSLIECEGYRFSPTMGLARYYSPGEGEMTNPLAWPYWATEKDLKGLPPHYLHLDGLDPLRDESSVYLQKLLKAGVVASGNICMGTVHCAAISFRRALPEEYKKLVGAIASFAKNL